MRDRFGHDLSVLVVDDDLTVRVYLRSLLKEFGFEVFEASSIEEGIEQLDAKAPDIALIDRNLSAHDGLELAIHIRENQPTCAPIIITGFASLDSALEAMRLGVEDYIQKPLTEADIGACLRRVTAMRARELASERRIEELEKKTTELEELAARDPLTKLFNHAFFQEALEREVVRSERYELSFGLLFIDLDGFKKINDTLGHLVGDQVLATFGQTLLGQTRRTDISFRLRAQDIAARYGGDEFAIILPETSLLGATTKAERLRAFIARHNLTLFDTEDVTVSIGVASFPSDASDRVGLIDAADVALYAAKRAGRNRMVAFTGRADADPHIPQHHLERLDALEQSIRGGTFDFRYQRVVDTEQDRVLGYEAFCRPRDQRLKNPKMLITIAETAGRIAALGRVLRRLAVAPLEQLPEDALLFINLHPHELYDSELTEIEPFLAPWANRVVLEITDTLSIDNFKRVRVGLGRLRDAGFRIAVDDLGSDYAGLNAVAKLEPEFVKLHMDLVRGALTDRRLARLAKHIIEYASDEAMDVIAMGIENEAERDRMRELGCSLMQGYYFGKPETAADVG